MKHRTTVCHPQVPSQCVESQSFTTPPVYSPGKQGAKTKTCSITPNLTEVGEFEKVIIPKRPRSSKKIPDGATGVQRKRYLPHACSKCTVYVLHKQHGFETYDGDCVNNVQQSN